MSRFYLVEVGKSGSGGLGCGAVLFCVLLFIASVASFWGNLDAVLKQEGGQLFFGLLVVCCVIGSIVCWRSCDADSFSSILSRTIIPYIVGALIFGIAAILGSKEGPTAGDVLVGLLGAPLIMAGACFPVVLVQSAILTALKSAASQDAS